VKGSTGQDNGIYCFWNLLYSSKQNLESQGKNAESNLYYSPCVRDSVPGSSKCARHGPDVSFPHLWSEWKGIITNQKVLSVSLSACGTGDGDGRPRVPSSSTDRSSQLLNIWQSEELPCEW